MTARFSRPTRTHTRLDCEMLEGRDVPSTMSSIAANFNGTVIPAGDTVWFTAALSATGLSKTAATTVHVENGTIDFTAAGTPYHLSVPNGVIVLTPGATSAAASFDPGDNDWDVSAPTGGTGDVFMGGVSMPVPGGLPGGIKNVTWSADFWTDAANVTINWKWSAAAYKPGFGTDYNALNVKPVDNNALSAYHNGDQSGTPEAYKTFLVAGATGGGGTNYTGNATPAAKVMPTLGNGLQDYPYPSSNPLTSIAFNESSVLRSAVLDAADGTFQVFYSDEHALALGVGTVNVKTATGTQTTTYPIAAMTTNPSVALNPAVGSTVTTGDQAGTDVSGRPMTPSLFLSDITTDPNNRSGDWQWGGTAIDPSAVFGTWKSFTRTVDYTQGGAVSVLPPLDPARNNWNLGTGSDPVPAGLTNEGYGSEIRWNLDDLYARGLLVPGHTYRFYVMVHDGDQNKAGGDAGQASFEFFYPGPAHPPAATASLSGHVYANTPVGTSPLPGVTVTLSGVDAFGAPVSLTTTTDDNGFYTFGDIGAGTYTVTQSPPGSVSAAGVSQPLMFSISAPGETNGVTGNGDGSDPSGTTITSIAIHDGDVGTQYDFTNFYGNPG
jgi:hypothetical protein